jgi:LAO/AO transport system kinase
MRVFSSGRWPHAEISADSRARRWTPSPILDAAGYARIIVETVGVGQDEVEIVKAADVSVVVLVPGMGDDIQAIKAGIMEIGDIFVINKADRDGVYSTERELEALLSLAARDDGWDPPIVKTVATENQGVADLAEAIERFRQAQRAGELSGERRRGDRALADCRIVARKTACSRFGV